MIHYVEAILRQSRDADTPSVVPHGHDETIYAQASRMGFLPGDEVAILKLSDLRALLANQKEAPAPRSVASGMSA